MRQQSPEYLAHLRRIGIQKGETRNPAGKKKGTSSHLTLKIKSAIEKAYAACGGDEGFIRWAKKHKTIFYERWISLLPRDVLISGEVDHKLIVQIKRYEIAGDTPKQLESTPGSDAIVELS